MHRVTSDLCAAVLSAIVVGAASVPFRGQSPPPATLAGRPAPLDRATLEHRLDELLNAHMQVNRFSGVHRLESLFKKSVHDAHGTHSVLERIAYYRTAAQLVGQIVTPSCRQQSALVSGRA